jgi:copper/silver efflux system protein
MIKSWIHFSAHNRFLVISLTALLCVLGVYSLKELPVDAIPDLSDPQVIVYSQWDRSPDIIENQVTYPLISALMSVPKVKTVRGSSDYGFSYIYVIFEDGVDLYWARDRVNENLSRLRGQLPEGVKTEIGPDASSTGWVYQYVLKDSSGDHTAADLRSLQDWVLKFQLQSVSGVAEVASIGGYQKQFQVKVDPTKLQIYNLSLPQVAQAVAESNQETGARTIEFSGAEAMVRSRALVETTEHIESAVIRQGSDSRSSVLVKQVAQVSIGGEQRRGVTDYNGMGDHVGGIIVMRQGEDVSRVIHRVKDKITDLQKYLPEGVEIITVYDRSDLIGRAIQTLRKTLSQELIIVSLIILLFLWHFPSAVVPIVTLPISVLLAFIPLYLIGESANIMSLAGIAISIGVLVDGAIVEVENAYRKIQKWDENGRPTDFFSVRLEALKEVGPSVFFSLLVIAVAFIPVFTLIDQEGRLFRPLALSKTFTMAVASLLAITFDPAVRMLFSRIEPYQGPIPFLNRLANRFLIGHYYPEERHPISRRLFQVYTPVVRWTLRHKYKTLALTLVACLSTWPAYQRLGSEFMPTLREGSLLYMPTALPGLSVSEAQKLLIQQDRIIKSFPEVESVFGKAGRADTSTDNAPLSMIETTIVLKDPSKWREQKRFYSFLPEILKSPFRWIWPDRIGEEQLIEEMDGALDFIGMPNIWTMPIKNRIDMLSTGIRSTIGIKVYGPSVEVIEQVGQQLEGVLASIPGARSVVAERSASGYFLDLDIDRDKLKLYGLSVQEVQDQMAMAIGGANVSQILSQRERYPIQVRLAPAFRQDVESIKRIPLFSQNQAQVPLESVARVSFNKGPGMVRDENASLVGYVYVDVDTSQTDLGRFVDHAKQAVDMTFQAPSGVVLEWAGQYQNMQRVKERLVWIIPLTLVLILFLLYFNTQSWVKTSIILLAVPFSMIGAVWFMYALGYNMSLATWVGIIALLGLDAETGVFMMLYLDLAYKERQEEGRLNNKLDLEEAIIEGAVHRVRPKMMTVTSLFVGLIPIMWSTGAGSDVMKRIAAPMIGGVFTSFLLELLIYPVLFYLWKERVFISEKINKS